MAFKKSIYAVCIILNILFAMHILQNVDRFFLGDAFDILSQNVSKWLIIID